MSADHEDPAAEIPSDAIDVTPAAQLARLIERIAERVDADGLVDQHTVLIPLSRLHDVLVSSQSPPDSTLSADRRLTSAHRRNYRVERKASAANRALIDLRAEHRALELRLAVAYAKLGATNSAHRRAEMLEQRLSVIRELTDLDAASS
jgi:hypothetical protein